MLFGVGKNLCHILHHASASTRLEPVPCFWSGSRSNAVGRASLGVYEAGCDVQLLVCFYHRGWVFNDCLSALAHNCRISGDDRNLHRKEGQKYQVLCCSCRPPATSNQQRSGSSRRWPSMMIFARFSVWSASFTAWRRHYPSTCFERQGSSAWVHRYLHHLVGDRAIVFRDPIILTIPSDYETGTVGYTSYMSSRLHANASWKSDWLIESSFPVLPVAWGASIVDHGFASKGLPTSLE